MGGWCAWATLDSAQLRSYMLAPETVDIGQYVDWPRAPGVAGTNHNGSRDNIGPYDVIANMGESKSAGLLGGWGVAVFEELGRHHDALEAITTQGQRAPHNMFPRLLHDGARARCIAGLCRHDEALNELDLAIERAHCHNGFFAEMWMCRDRLKALPAARAAASATGGDTGHSGERAEGLAKLQRAVAAMPTSCRSEVLEALARGGLDAFV